jgi:hypothetical protein
MSYVDLFSGIGIASSGQRLISAVITSPLVLKWPRSSVRENEIFPGVLLIEPGSTSHVVFPPAESGSQGSSVIISNRASQTINILNSNNAVIRNLPPSKSVVGILRSLDPGVWEFVEIGENPSSAVASDLAGNGLTFFNQKILSSIKTHNFSFSTPVDVNRRGELYNWTGAGGVLTLPNASSWPEGYYVYVRNSGSSSLNIEPVGVTLNGSGAMFSVPVGRSILLVFDGSEWKTIHDQEVPTVSFTSTSIALSGTGTRVLTSFEKSFEIITFTGALTGPVTIEFGNSVGVWYLRDITTGSQDLIIKSTSLSTGINVGQGASVIVVSDGTNLTLASGSGSSSGVTSVATNSDLTGGPITTTGTLSLSTTGVVAGTYGGSASSTVQFTVDNKGRITAASGSDLRASAAEVLAAASSSKFITPSEIGPFARKDTQQTFTQPQSISIGSASSVLNVVSTDSGSTSASLTLDRNSSSPAANDELFDLAVTGRDDAAQVRTFAVLKTLIRNAASAASESEIKALVRLNNTLTEALSIRNGLVVGPATGGFLGTGTVNATGFFINGSSFGSGRLIAYTEFLSSGTWTPNAATTRYTIFGRAGGRRGAWDGINLAGAGGQSGFAGTGWFVGNPGAQAVTIGAGVAATSFGSGNSAAVAVGGSTSVGALFVVPSASTAAREGVMFGSRPTETMAANTTFNFFGVDNPAAITADAPANSGAGGHVQNNNAGIVFLRASGSGIVRIWEYS